MSQLTYAHAIGMKPERSGLFCRYNCELDGVPWRVMPKTSSSEADLMEAVAVRNKHELEEHGQVFPTKSFDSKPMFNQSITRKKADVKLEI